MPRPSVVRNDTLDLQTRGVQGGEGGGGGALGTGQSQAATMRNVAEEQAQAQLNINISLDVDFTDIRLNDPGAIGGTPGDLIRSGREAQAAEAESDDQFDERVSSSPSIDDEDIDFEFVYALHTFVATVEGQANAVKGETMVLLDDSNSYWWLVRIVKDQSIGYLPAEHIETPSERLARLNKHRNVDLSAAMLHDAPAKSQNPIRNALRRRGAKAVAFAPVQYFEYTPPSEDEGSGAEQPETGPTEEPEELEQMAQKDDAITVVEPLQTSRSGASGADVVKASPVVVTPDSGDAQVRKNSNSSFKDIDTALSNADKIETKKITLTPRVAQDDSSLGATPISPLGKDRRTGSERERVQRIREELISPPPKGAKGRKGSSVLGLFKKRKKGKKDDEVEEHAATSEKDPLDGRDSQDSTELQNVSDPRRLEPKREPPKLAIRKETRQEPKPEPVRQIPAQLQHGGLTIRKVEPDSPIKNQHLDHKLSIDTSNNVRPSNGGTSSLSVDESTKDQAASDTSFENTPIEKDSSPSSPNVNQVNGQLGNVKVESILSSPRLLSPPEMITPTSDSSATSGDQPSVQSPDALMPLDDRPPALVPDNDSEEHFSPVESTQEAFDTATDAPFNRAVTWSDSSLKAFLDETNEVRDFLVLVHDKSGVKARNDHPDIVPLFRDANAILQDLTNRLDGLLGDYLQRRGRS